MAWKMLDPPLILNLSLCAHCRHLVPHENGKLLDHNHGHTGEHCPGSGAALVDVRNAVYEPADWND